MKATLTLAVFCVLLAALFVGQLALRPDEPDAPGVHTHDGPILTSPGVLDRQIVEQQQANPVLSPEAFAETLESLSMDLQHYLGRMNEAQGIAEASGDTFDLAGVLEATYLYAHATATRQAFLDGKYLVVGSAGEGVAKYGDSAATIHEAPGRQTVVILSKDVSYPALHGLMHDWQNTLLQAELGDIETFNRLPKSERKSAWEAVEAYKARLLEVSLEFDGTDIKAMIEARKKVPRPDPWIVPRGRFVFDRDTNLAKPAVLR